MDGRNSTNFLDIVGLCAFAFPRNPLIEVVLGKLQWKVVIACLMEKM
jgi:hypothetical protein